MKSVFALSLLILGSSVSFAAANCPADTKEIQACASAPQPGDSELAATVFESISICQKGKQTFMAVEASGQTEVERAKMNVLAGGTTYSVTAKDVKFSLSVTTGIKPGTSKPARLTVQFAEADVSGASTYTCK